MPEENPEAEEEEPLGMWLECRGVEWPWPWSPPLIYREWVPVSISFSGY